MVSARVRAERLTCVVYRQADQSKSELGVIRRAKIGRRYGVRPCRGTSCRFGIDRNCWAFRGWKPCPGVAMSTPSHPKEVIFARPPDTKPNPCDRASPAILRRLADARDHERIFYVMRSGCPSRLQPGDLSPWSTICRSFAKFRDESRF